MLGRLLQLLHLFRLDEQIVAILEPVALHLILGFDHLAGDLVDISRFHRQPVLAVEDAEMNLFGFARGVDQLDAA